MPAKTKPTTITKNASGELTSAEKKMVIRNTIDVMTRQQIASGLGQSFEGKRDLYEVLGYPLQITNKMLWNMYDRDGLATIATDGIAMECWRKSPIFQDGTMEWNPDEPDAPDQESKTTPFLTKLKLLNNKVNFLAAMQQADKMLGYSRYALIFLGAPGDYSQELTSTNNIEYLQVFDELDAGWTQKEADPNNPRFGLPNAWNLTFADDDKAIPVHWTRVIHIREGAEKRSRIYGVPRMRKIYNYLMDLQKVLGGSSEAFWLLINRGLAIIAQEGIEMPQKGTAEYQAFQDEVSDYMNKIQRFMRLRGFDVKELGGSVVDGGGQVSTILDAIAGSIRTPKRILIGSERGELASTQDDKNFADVAQDRQKNFCYPFIVKLFVDRLIGLKVIPEPNVGIDSYHIKAQNLFELNDLEKSTLANNVASAINTITGGSPEVAMLLDDFMKKYLGYGMTSKLIQINKKKIETIRTADQNPPTQPAVPGNNGNGNNLPAKTQPEPAGAKP